MARPLLVRTDACDYHVTIRSNNKEWFYIPPTECWDIFTRCLGISCEKYETEIRIFVQMSNHLHFIISTPRKNLDDSMRYFISISTMEIQRRAGRINHIFGGRYKWSMLETASSLAYVYKYIARNPVRAGLSTCVEEYPYSSLNQIPALLPISEGFSGYWSLIPKHPLDRLRWLNKPVGPEAEDLVGRALKRYRFGFSNNRNFIGNMSELRRCYGVE